MGGPALVEGAKSPSGRWPTPGPGACGYWREVPTPVSCGCLECPALGCGYRVGRRLEEKVELVLPAQGPLAGADSGSAKGPQFPEAPAAAWLSPQPPGYPLRQEY